MGICASLPNVNVVLFVTSTFNLLYQIWSIGDKSIVIIGQNSAKCNVCSINFLLVCRHNLIFLDDDFPTTIHLQCTAGECVTSPAPKPSPPDDESWRYQLAAGVAGGTILLFLFVTMGISCIFSVVHTVKVTKEYDLMKHETHGASLEFRDLAYYLKVREKGKLVNKKLLKGVSYSIRPGVLFLFNFFVFKFF